MASSNPSLLWCNTCGQVLDVGKQMRCGKCKVATYCSRECQEADWQVRGATGTAKRFGHKHSCGKALTNSDLVAKAQTDLEFAEYRYMLDTDIAKFERTQFAIVVSGAAALRERVLSLEEEPVVSQDVAFSAGIFLGKHATTSQKMMQFNSPGAREGMLCMGHGVPGPQWKTILLGILRAQDSGHLVATHDNKELIIHIIGVRSWTDGITDWCSLRRWLRKLVWPNMEKLRLVLSGFFEDDRYEDNKNCVRGQREWNEICMKRDPSLQIDVTTGPWHRCFDACTEVDIAVMLEPGFHSQLHTWYDTLKVLQSMCQRSSPLSERQRLPVVVSGQTLWNSDMLERDACDVQLYEQVVQDLGFGIVAPRSRNPFSAIWQTDRHEHPNLNLRHHCCNGFLLVALGDDSCEPLPLPDVHTRACIRKAECAIVMERSYGDWDTDRGWLINGWARVVGNLSSGELRLPVDFDVDQLEQVALRQAFASG